ncbi:MAG: hypothetical protein WAN43_14490 [Rhodomicrobium sp.]
MNDTQTNIRTLGVLLAGFVALVIVGHSAQRVQVSLSARAVQAPVVDKAPEVAPVKAEAPSFFKKAAPQLVAIPAAKCASTWINGGNYVLVTPQTCNDVSIASITIGVSAKSCEASTKADFQSLTNSTAFKGDYGFYVGQGRTVKCLAVQEILGKYL